METEVAGVVVDIVAILIRVRIGHRIWHICRGP
jgi:hypothetical protein